MRTESTCWSKRYAFDSRQNEIRYAIENSLLTWLAHGSRGDQKGVAFFEEEAG